MGISVVAAVVLSLGIGWSSYQMTEPVRELENIQAEAATLQKRIKAAKETEAQLLQLSERSQAGEIATFLKRGADVRKESLSIGDDLKALAEELALARSQFDQANQTRAHRELVLVLCVLVLATLLILGAVYTDAIRRRSYA